MIPFFSPLHHRKEQIAGRAAITLAAFLFLLTALVTTIPSKDRLADLLEESGLSGYHRTEETTPSRPTELEEFYDRPQTEHPQPSASPESEKPTIPDHSSLHYSSGGANAKIA